LRGSLFPRSKILFFPRVRVKVFRDFVHGGLRQRKKLVNRFDFRPDPFLFREKVLKTVYAFPQERGSVNPAVGVGVERVTSGEVSGDFFPVVLRPAL
jgi:hypothetical protein